MTELTVDCDRCRFEEKTTSYERAQDIYDQHHIRTGHRQPIKEEDSFGEKKFTVVCSRHGDVGETDFYERAKSISESHHITSGCRPTIEEN